MKKYIKSYIFLIVCCAIATQGWSQSDTIQNNEEVSSKGTISIAYGKMKKNNVTSSISSVSGEELQKGSVSNLGNALIGRFPGLFVRQGGGEPGNNSPTLRIRGAAYAPLIIIDGFERDMTYVAPEEIESVSVLKDGSALALYGMKGSNGAILITTKRGTAQKRELNVSIQSGMQSPQNTMDVLDATKYMSMYNQAALNDGLPAKYSEADIAAAGSSPLYPNVNWKDLVIKDFSNITKANIGLRGGSEYIKYFFNIGGLYNTGIYKPENEEMNANVSLMRLNIRSNIDVQVTKNTVFSLDLAGSVDKNIHPADNSSKLWNSILTLPPNEFNAVNPDGSYGGSYLSHNNPLGMLEYTGDSKSLSRVFNASFRLKQDLGMITDGLSVGLGYALDNGSTNGDGTWRHFQVKQVTGQVGDTYSYESFRENYPYSKWSNALSNRFIIYTGDINYTMPEKNGNKLNVLLRYQGDQQYRTNNDLSPYLTNNYAGRINYSKDNKYLLELAASYFGSDQYADGKQYGFFPSASAGWVFTNEGFAKNSTLLTYGKIKASYGITGYNRAVNGRYPYAQFYNNSGSYRFGTDWASFGGTAPGVLANEDVQWEISNKMNVGVELELFNKLSLEAEYYQNKRSNVLYVDYTIPSVSGATLPYENIGKLTDTGVDVKLGYTENSKKLKWYADLVFSYYNNTIDEMGESLNTGEMAHLNKTGNSATAIYGYKTVGYYESAADIQSSPTQTFGTPRVGDLKYKDMNNDDIIDSRDMTAIGDRMANIDLGLRLGASYKNFDIEAMLQGQFNKDINLHGNKLAEPFIHGNAVNEIAEEDGFPTLSLSNMNNYQSSSYWVRKGDFLKLRNVELGYSLGTNALSSLNMQKVRFFVRGINVLTMSKWKYTDPEYTSIGYPSMKSYLLGVNIDF